MEIWTHFLLQLELVWRDIWYISLVYIYQDFISLWKLITESDPDSRLQSIIEDCSSPTAPPAPMLEDVGVAAILVVLLLASRYHPDWSTSCLNCRLESKSDSDSEGFINFYPQKPFRCLFCPLSYWDWTTCSWKAIQSLQLIQNAAVWLAFVVCVWSKMQLYDLFYTSPYCCAPYMGFL